MPARKPPEFRCRTGIRLIRELAADRIDVAGACRVLTVSMAGGLALGSTTKGRHHKLARGLGGSKVQTRSFIGRGFAQVVGGQVAVNRRIGARAPG
jgi:hypothetical protein